MPHDASYDIVVIAKWATYAVKANAFGTFSVCISQKNGHTWHWFVVEYIWKRKEIQCQIQAQALECKEMKENQSKAKRNAILDPGPKMVGK